MKIHWKIDWKSTRLPESDGPSSNSGSKNHDDDVDDDDEEEASQTGSLSRTC